MNTKLPGFSRLPHNLYYTGSPVLICSATIHKQNGTFEVLKIKNISNKTIKSMQVEIVQQDHSGANIGSRILHTYENLNCAQDEIFGEDAPIPLKAPSIYTIYLHVMKVTFKDGTDWDGFGNHFEPLDPPTPLEKDDFAKEYKATFGEQSKYLFEDRTYLWVCPCGSFNGSTEEKCPNCGIELDTLKKNNPSVIREKINERIAKERKEFEDKAKATAKKTL